MLRLGGQFAGILRIEVPEASVSALLGALSDLKTQGLTVVVCRDETEPMAPANRLISLEIVGHDRPGIVRGGVRVRGIRR